MKNKHLPSRREFLRVGAGAASLMLFARRGPPSAAVHRARADWPVQPFFVSSDIRIGMIGHIDHGKTTLTSAVTRLLSLSHQAIFKPYDVLDNPPEQIVHGLPLAMAEVSCRTAARAYALVDGPHPMDYLGSLDLDGVILVVSAVDGPMPQTREHLLQAKQIGIPAVVVFLNKTDLMEDEELLALIELELSELLTSSGYSADAAVIRGSALLAASSRTIDPYVDAMLPIMELMNSIDMQIPTPPRLQSMPFLMPVAEELFSIQGEGTMVAGYVERGTIAVGDRVDIVGGRGAARSAVVSEVAIFQGKSDVPQAGDDIGLLLEGISSADLSPGMVVAQPDSIHAHRYFMSDVYVLTQEEGGRRRAFFSGDQLQFFIRNAEVMGTITLSAGVESALPGNVVSIEVELAAPAALELETRFSIYSSAVMIATGIVTRLLD